MNQLKDEPTTSAIPKEADPRLISDSIHHENYPYIYKGCSACRDSAIMGIFVWVFMFGLIFPMMMVALFQVKDPAATLAVGACLAAGVGIGGALAPGAIHRAQKDSYRDHIHR